MFGLMGKLLRVNLTEGSILQEEIPEEKAKKFLGGRGLGTKYLFDELTPGIDPLGPENKLIFMTGLLTGTPSPSASRYSVVTKSPLTNIWAQSSSGGRWGVDLKQSGFDGIIFDTSDDNILNGFNTYLDFFKTNIFNGKKLELKYLDLFKEKHPDVVEKWNYTKGYSTCAEESMLIFKAIDDGKAAETLETMIAVTNSK